MSQSSRAMAMDGMDLARSCHGNHLCVQWLAFLTRMLRSRPKLAPSYGWPEVQACADGLQVLELHKGQLLLQVNGDRKRPNWLSRAINPRQKAHPPVALIDAWSTAVGNQEIWDNMLPTFNWLVHVPQRALVLPTGIVMTSAPLTVLDLSGGCCRPAAPVSAKALATMHRHRKPLPRWVRTSKLEDLAHEAVNATEYEWLYVCQHHHGSTYFHGLAEGTPRLLWGLNLIRNMTQIRVLTSAKVVTQVMDVLGLSGRAVLWTGNVMYARKLTIPPNNPYQSPSPSRTKGGRKMWGAMLRYIRTELIGTHVASRAQHPATCCRVVVVHRAATRRNARAMLNADELTAVLTHIVGADSLMEWPAGGTLAQAVREWSTARLAIVPHGAGTTNIMFMPPNSTVVEILAVEQRGRVYKTLADFLGHRYIVCMYNRTDAAYMSQIPSVTGDSFVLNMPSFLRCLQKNLYGPRAPAVLPWSDAASLRFNQVIEKMSVPNRINPTGKADALRPNTVVKARPVRSQKRAFRSQKPLRSRKMLKRPSSKKRSISEPRTS